MLASLVALTLVGVDPGPIDAFRANYAASKLEMKTRYRCGYVSGSAVAAGRLWSTPTVALEEKPELEILGEWSCDGTAEAYRYGSPPEVALADRTRTAQIKGSGRFKLLHVPNYEGIYDGELEVGHYFDEAIFRTKTLSIEVLKSPSGTMPAGSGPYCWWPSYPFPAKIRMDFPGIIPQRSSGVRSNHQVEVEVYLKQTEGASQILEVSYDPAVGFLPRFVRHLIREGKGAVIREFYLIDANMCVAGGFVPAEWYTTTFKDDLFARHYPAYSHETVLEPADEVFVGHFKADSFRDRSKAVELTRLRDVTYVDAPGGQTRLSNNPNTLTLANLKSIVGRKLRESVEPALPTLDVTELNAYKQPSRSTWPFYVGSALIVVVLGVMMKWRARALSINLLLACLPGCGRVGAPIPKISASFQDTPQLYDVRNLIVPLKLVIRNDGNVPLRITKADGGCSCREVDRVAFPADLAPGEMLATTVKFSHGRTSTPQALPFTFETDHGVLNATANAHVLPQNQLSPESPSAYLVEGETQWNINLVHRSIYREGSPRRGVRLVVPADFQQMDTTSIEGNVGGAPGFRFRDDTYIFGLKDDSLGLHKAVFQVVDEKGIPLADSTAVWDRSRYLSSVPATVALGTIPTRVFLRCPDVGVELTKVVEAPPGVKAFISSPREVIVTLDGGASRIIKGDVVVATTALERPPLRIGVMRYSSD